MNEIKLYEKAINKWGELSQILVAIEEMSELQKELCKLDRCKTILSKETQIRRIADEIADVSIMIEQLVHIFNFYELVREKKIFKLNRLKERLDL